MFCRVARTAVRASTPLNMNATRITPTNTWVRPKRIAAGWIAPTSNSLITAIPTVTITKTPIASRSPHDWCKS